MVSDASFMLAIASGLTYFLLHDHKITQGIAFVLLGAASYLVVTDQPYGLAIILLGFIRIITAPYSSEDR